MPGTWVFVILFVVGAGLAIAASEVLLRGLVGLADGLRLSAFVVGAVLSGLEAENIAVGLAAGASQVAVVALGTVYGGAMFLMCVALGVAALAFPMEVRLPRSVLLLFAASPVLAGLPLMAPVTPRWSGAVLLVAFGAAMGYLIVTARRLRLRMTTDELEEARERRYPLWLVLAMTVAGLVLISLAGELVAHGAAGLIVGLGIPAPIMGMVITPAAIELEEVARQAVPSRHGRHDVSAGNLVGTLLYFALCTLGLIALLTPVRVHPLVRELDWPALVVATWLATAFLWRGRVGRVAGALLLGLYALYLAAHVLAG